MTPKIDIKVLDLSVEFEVTRFNLKYFETSWQHFFKRLFFRQKIIFYVSIDRRKKLCFYRGLLNYIVCIEGRGMTHFKTSKPFNYCTVSRVIKFKVIILPYYIELYFIFYLALWLETGKLESQIELHCITVIA